MTGARHRPGFLLLILLAAAMLWAGPGRAEAPPRILAVLVGVSDYGDDPLGLGDLSGPRNDVLLMADALVDRGADPADIRILTTAPERARYVRRHAVPVAGPPDLAAIRAALDAMLDTARPGDQAVIHLAGHGWRQREAIRGSEISGLDEVFLPAGYGPLPAEFDRLRLDPVEGVLLDNEIGRYIDRLRGLGADVTFIGDFCHAGDATRGRPDFAPDFARSRRDPRMDVGAPSAPAGRRVGAYAAFFAAPAGDRAMQGMAPIWAAGPDRAPHGLLSVYMAAALSDPTAATWADVAARIQASLIEHDVRDHAVRLDAPAQFEGELDRPVLGRGGDDAPPWTVLKPALRVVDGRAGLSELTLNAGALHGLTENSLTVLSETREGRERTVLYARAVDVRPARARLVPADGPGATAADWADLRTPEGRPYTDERLWSVRVEERGVLLAFRVAPPRRPSDRRLARALERLRGDGLDLDWADPDEEAQLYLHEAPGRLVLSESPDPHAAGAALGTLDLMRAGRGGADYLRQALADALMRAARTWRVRSLLAALDGPGDESGAGLRTELYLWRPQAAPPGACPPFHPGHRGLTERPPADAAPFEVLGLDEAQPPVLRPCDVIFTRIVNAGRATLDVTPLAFSPDGAIWALPWMDGRPAVRFEPGRARMTAVQLDPADPLRIPREEMAVIAVLADPQGGAPASFARLQQPGVASLAAPSPSETTRSGDTATPLMALLEEARFGAVRSASAPVAPEGVSVRRFSWRVETP